MDIFPTYTLGDLVLTDYPFAVEFGGDHGAPESVTEVVEAMLADGDIVSHLRDGNRELTLTVLVEGPDFLTLAENEATLRRECAKARNVLLVDPGDGFGVPTAFETFRASMRLQRDDTLEQHMMRRWQVTIPAAPYARSADLTTVEALEVPVTETTAVIDTCDSVTGWTGTRNGAPSPADGPTTIYEAGAVAIAEFSNTAGFPPETWTLTRTGVVDFTTTPYLVAELTTLSAKGGAPLDVEVYADGVRLPVLSIEKLTDGTNYYQMMLDTSVHTSSGAVGSLTFSHTSAGGLGHAWQGLYVRHLSRTDMPPSITPRQVSRTIEIGGTERTTGSFQIASTDAADLYVTMVHTCPASDVRGADGYSPSLVRWRTSGNVQSTDAARFSGYSEPLSPAAVVAQVPNSVLPDGPYFVAAMIHSDTTKDSRVFWAVRTITDGGAGVDIHGSVGGSAVASFTAGIWGFVPLGVVTLPVAAAVNASTQIDIQSETGDPATLTLDDAYLFWMGDGCGFTLLSDAKTRLWLDTPDLSSPVPTYWTGDDAGRSDAHHPGDVLLSPGVHPLLPGRMRVWTATLGTTMPDVSATYYKRWHSNAAE